ncbi:DNA-binding transcriptional regulator GbsR (MarR family) [Streptomyces sp. SAI-127]|nr:DNA-binding transcriptional regulator GbsR (MarR family) [Streptomyces sp. SAI-127]
MTLQQDQNCHDTNLCHDSQGSYAANVPHDTQLIFADHLGRFYARQYGFPPMAGRLLGYLFVCDPPQQTIDELSEALLASRSAITGAVKLLEGYQMARRTRTAGERVDRVSLNPVSQQPQHFDSAVHKEHAELFREGLALLADAPPERRAPLEEMIALAEFLAARLPALLNEWHKHRDQLRAPTSQPASPE